MQLYIYVEAKRSLRNICMNRADKHSMEEVLGTICNIGKALMEQQKGIDRETTKEST